MHPATRQKELERGKVRSLAFLITAIVGRPKETLHSPISGFPRSRTEGGREVPVKRKPLRGKNLLHENASWIRRPEEMACTAGRHLTDWGRGGGPRMGGGRKSPGRSGREFSFSIITSQSARGDGEHVDKHEKGRESKGKNTWEKRRGGFDLIGGEGPEKG